MKIVIYTKTGCPWCAEALGFLKAHNFQFEEREVTSHPEFFQELLELSGQTKTPTITLDGVLALSDTDASAIETYFRKLALIK